MPKGSVVNFIHNQTRLSVLQNGFALKFQVMKIQEMHKKIFAVVLACGESLIGKASYSARPPLCLTFP